MHFFVETSSFEASLSRKLHGTLPELFSNCSEPVRFDNGVTAEIKGSQHLWAGSDIWSRRRKSRGKAQEGDLSVQVCWKKCLSPRACMNCWTELYGVRRVVGH